MLGEVRFELDRLVEAGLFKLFELGKVMYVYGPFNLLLRNERIFYDVAKH